jgi:DNA transformation protein
MAGGMQAQMEELFAVVEGVAIRRMFGGLGMFRQGLMFALVADDVLYMKADETTSPAYEAEGGEQWVYDGKDRPVPMPYWRLPERLYDEPDEFREWALAAFAVAERTAKKPKPKRKPATEAKAEGKQPARKATAKKRPARRVAAQKRPAVRPSSKKLPAKTSTRKSKPARSPRKAKRSPRARR